MNSNDDDGSNGAYHQNSLAARCTGLVLLVSVYVSGLLGCIIAGASAPDLFTSTTTSSPSGISSASGDYAFPTTGFKVRRTPGRLSAWCSLTPVFLPDHSLVFFVSGYVQEEGKSWFDNL